MSRLRSASAVAQNGAMTDRRPYVVLLRGVNVGRHQRIAMADLRQLLTELGFTDVRTVLQSGNAVGLCPPQDPVALARRIEQALADSLALRPVAWSSPPTTWRGWWPGIRSGR